MITLTTQQHESYTALVNFAVNVCTCLAGVLDGSKHTQKLPAAIMGKVWGNFLKLWFNPALHQVWSSYLAAVETPSSLQTEASLMLQLLLDQLFKHFIKPRAEESNPPINTYQRGSLTLCEQNVVRYTRIPQHLRNWRAKGSCDVDIDQSAGNMVM